MQTMTASSSNAIDMASMLASHGNGLVSISPNSVLQNGSGSNGSISTSAAMSATTTMASSTGVVQEINTSEYLAQLIKDKNQLAAFPNVFLHLERLLDEEISRIRVNLFQLGNKDALTLPEPIGQVQQLTEKLYVPVKDHPEFNFVGRILGPRGMTAKQLEQETGCKIMVRGKGSMRDKTKEDQMKGKPNWEHLNDELHVLITVEDTKNRADVKIRRAIEEIKKLLVPAPEGEDELKKKQLMELAIINGTYRDGNKLIQQKLNQILIPGGAAGNAYAAAAAAMQQAVNQQNAANTLRSPPNHIGQPLIISPRLTPHMSGGNQSGHQVNTNLLNGSQLLTTGDPNSLYYTTIPTANLQAFYPTADGGFQTLDYPGSIDLSQAGSLKQQRFSTVNSASMRAHPYARVALS